MQPILAELQVLSQEKRSRWLPNSVDALVLKDRENICTELRIMHIAIILFAVLAATCAFTLTACGIIIPILHGHIISGCIKITVGLALGCLAYDLNNLREVVERTSAIFEDYMHFIRKGEITNEMQEGWKRQTEILKNAYRNLFFVHNLLDTVWPLTNRTSVA